MNANRGIKRGRTHMTKASDLFVACLEEEGVEYVDTSAYEQYEKQEGDFVEGEPVVEAAAEEAPAEESPAVDIAKDGAA